MEPQKLSKAEQARLNGAKSSGPKTPEGLQRCRQASVTHGMWVAHMSTFPHEAQVDYAAVLASAIDQFHPRNMVESTVRLLADALWRAGRLGALANLDIDREMFLIQQQATVAHEPEELHLLAEQHSKSVARLEARARHYTREVARLMEMLRKLQNWPVSTEASHMLNEIKESHIAHVPETETPQAKIPTPPPPIPATAPPPARKPAQRAEITPRNGSVTRRK